jgi:hypothetical protein
LRRWLYVNEPLVTCSQEIWRVVAREEAWRWLCHWLQKADFERFATAATLVLAEINPRYDLPSVRWFYSNLNGDIPAHSSTLHKAMAETLCLLALRTNESELSDRAKQTVREVVTGIFYSKSDWKLWASLDYWWQIVFRRSPSRQKTSISSSVSAVVPPQRASSLGRLDEFLGQQIRKVNLASRRNL